MASINLTKKTGGGLDIWEESNFEISKFEKYLDSTSISDDFTIPPKTFLDLDGNPPTIKSLFFLLINIDT